MFEEERRHGDPGDDTQVEIQVALVEADELFFSALTGPERKELGRLLRKVSDSQS